MRKLLSLVALGCAMVLAVAAFAPRASAVMLTTDVLAVKGAHATAVLQARYRCWWRHGYRQCGYVHHRRRWWRHHHGYGYWGHRHWRHRYWHNRYWRHRHAWRGRYYGHRHYYYRPYYSPYRAYYRPHYRRYYRPYAYCIGICWW